MAFFFIDAFGLLIIISVVSVKYVYPIPGGFVLHIVPLTFPLRARSVGFALFCPLFNFFYPQVNFITILLVKLTM